MTQKISGPGVGLPLPQNLYPTQLQNSVIDISTNQICLNAGDTFLVPAGEWWVDTGMYSVLQYLDPVNGVWNFGPTPGWLGGKQFVISDGYTTRVANLLGCPVGAVVIAYGSAYVQASTTLTQTPGTGTWLPIVGGQLTLVGGTLTSNGAGYGVAPLVLIPPPPPAQNNANGVGGLPASAYAVIASATISGITFTNPGAGYPVAPTPVIVPSPFDPSINTGITAGVAAFSLVGSGSITGALNTNPGAPLANPANISLVLAGAGSAGSVNAVVLQTCTAVSATGIGVGYGTGTNPIQLSTAGGNWPAGTVTNSPEFLGLRFRPRPMQAAITPAGTGSLAAGAGTIYDGGLFASTPTLVLSMLPATSVATVGTFALTLGNRPDIIQLQPAA